MQYLSKRDIFGVAKLVLRPVRPVQDTTAITLPVQFTHTPLANWSEKINALQSTKCESASTDYYQKFLNCFECLQIGICRGISTLNLCVGIKLQCLSFKLMHASELDLKAAKNQIPENDPFSPSTAFNFIPARSPAPSDYILPY